MPFGPFSPSINSQEFGHFLIYNIYIFFSELTIPWHFVRLSLEYIGQSSMAMFTIGTQNEESAAIRILRTESVVIKYQKKKKLSHHMTKESQPHYYGYGNNRNTVNFNALNGNNTQKARQQKKHSCSMNEKLILKNILCSI